MKTEHSKLIRQKDTPADGKIIDNLIAKGELTEYSIQNKDSVHNLPSDQATTNKQTNDESLQLLKHHPGSQSQSNH